MNFIDFTAGTNDNDRRIDKVIRVLLPEISLTDIYKSFRKNLIKINNKKVKGETRVKTGDIISIPEFMVKNNSTTSPKNNDSLLNKLPEIIFENSNIIIFNKPYDLLVQGNQTSLDKITREYYRQNFSDNSLSFTPGPLHRIDRKTTGLIAFSLSIEGARWFTENIKVHNIKKTYLTLMEGTVSEPEHWEDFIEKDEEQDAKAFHKVSVQQQKIENSKAKNAVTDVKPIAYGDFFGKPVTLVEVSIQTGRMHQIRAQSAHHKHPLAGDTAYGGENLLKHNINHEFFLHAWKLSVPENPVGLPSIIKAPLPIDFENFLFKTCSIKNCEL